MTSHGLSGALKTARHREKRASPRRPTRASLVRRLSVRRGITAVLLLLVAIAVGGSFVTIGAVSDGAFLLRRAETSYRQLSAYQQLSTDMLEYLVQPQTEADGRRASIEGELRELEGLVAYEDGLVRDNGGVENNTSEGARLGRIRTTIEAMFAGAHGTTVDMYRQGLKPLLIDAIADERTEVIEVERAMRALKADMRWVGAFGVLLQTMTALLVFVLVNRAVLGPIATLVADIKEIGRQRLGHRALVPRRDEFGLLAQHINRMARNLEHGRSSLLAANSGLEATVAERTRSLQQRNDDLHEIDLSRRRFFADVSHELRTPLTAIVGEADVTLRIADAGSGPYREALASILANSTYLNRRIDDLMALARSADGMLDIEMGVVDLNLVCAEAMGEVATLAKVNRVETRFEPEPEPILVRGDRLRLRQCLMILLDNAVKFSRGNQAVDVVIGLRDTHVDVTVVDRGRGIPVHELPHVFERYYQTEVGRRMGGTGLGLSIARRIVEAHGGSIVADSNAAGGTAITMTFVRSADTAQEPIGFVRSTAAEDFAT